METFKVGEYDGFQPFAGTIMEEVIAIDVPFFLDLDKDIPASLQLTKIGCSTKFRIEVVVGYGETLEEEIFEFPIRIQRYDTLPLFGKFNEPITNIGDSLDMIARMEYSIPNSCVGPGDEFLANLKIVQNYEYAKQERWRRQKIIAIKKITMEIIETISMDTKDDPVVKKFKVASTSQDANVHLSLTGYVAQLAIIYPNELANIPSGIVDGLSVSNSKNVPFIEEQQDVLMENMFGFTTTSKHYKIGFEVVIKVKFTNCKDLEVRQDITVCPYDRIASVRLLNWLVKEGEMVKKLMDEKGIGYGVAKPRLYPKLYRLKSKQDWVNLGLAPVGYGNFGKNLIHLID